MADNENKTVAVEEKKAPSKPEKKDKPSFFKKIGDFFRACKSELKKIVWYSKQDTFNSTLLVVIVLIVCSAAISLLDYGFSSAVSALGKLL